MRFWFTTLVLELLLACPLLAQPVVLSSSEPVLESIFPLGGRRGMTIEAEIRGKALDGGYALWFDSEGLKSRVLRVEKIEDPAKENLKKASGDSSQEQKRKDPGSYRVIVQIEIDSSARVGSRSFNLISPRGLSNQLRFQLNDDPVIDEVKTPHRTAQQAQWITIPQVVNGTISQSGELDYYQFTASAGQEIALEIVAAEGFDPELALYQASASWLTPHRPTRLNSIEERASDLIPLKPRFTYRLVETGRYYVEIGSLFGKGAPNCAYQLRISLAGAPRIPEVEAEDSPKVWQERTFTRRLLPDWMEMLWSRTLKAPELKPGNTTGSSSSAGAIETNASSQAVDFANTPKSPSPVEEREPNDERSEALTVSIPALVKGIVERPGDVDSFKFRVKAGQGLAFEIETPDAKPPRFNPRLALLNSEKVEILTNIHKRTKLISGGGGENSYLKGVEAKVIYTFERDGEYTLQIRDVTSRYGNSSYVYRVLIRPQIPHLGEVGVGNTDRINLTSGEAKKLNIIVSQEEGFTGEVALQIKGLPEGVDVLPGGEVEGRRPNEVSDKEESFVPKLQKTTFILLASENALLTNRPQQIELSVRPIVNGKPGPLLPVKEIPLMVVAKPERVKGE